MDIQFKKKLLKYVFAGSTPKYFSDEDIDEKVYIYGNTSEEFGVTFNVNGEYIEVYEDEDDFLEEMKRRKYDEDLTLYDIRYDTIDGFVIY